MEALLHDVLASAGRDTMRKFLTVMIAVVCAGSASADHIGLYRDPAGQYCALQSPPVGPPPFALYVIHRFNAGASGSQFRVLDTTGFFATTQSTIGPTLGTWNTDWSISYGGCLIGDLQIATLNFLYFGTPLLCTNWMGIHPAPTSAIVGEIIYANCAQEFETATGGRIWFGPASHDDILDCWCVTLAVREATWGAVKALYR